MSSKIRYKQGLVKARRPLPAPVVATPPPPSKTISKCPEPAPVSKSGSTEDTSSKTLKSEVVSQAISTSTSSTSSTTTMKTTTTSKVTRSVQSNKSENSQFYTAKRPPEVVRELLEDVGYDPDRRKIKRATKSCRVVVEDTPTSPWSPASYAAFKLIVSSRFAAALWTTISDCDETYNYWEPAHFLLYGKGFQTWEYSPEYALRSYTYVLIHAVPAKLYDYFLSPNPLLIFFFIRCILALISALTELLLYRGVRRYFGGNVARIALVTSLFSPGMFISTSAFLPSAFSSYMTALAIGAWLEELHELAILGIAVSALLSWPFAALTGFFIAFDIVVLQRKIWTFVSWSAISLSVVLFPIIGIDSAHYGKLVIAPLNIVKYNIFSSKGPELYGTEPWSYYLVNGFLNFNVVFILALLSPLFLLLSWRYIGRGTIAAKEKLVVVGTMLLWFAVFILQPHKEERFLFPIYPLIPLCGAIGVDCSLNLAEKVYLKILQIPVNIIQPVAKMFRKCDTSQAKSVMALAFVVFASVIGSSRIVALHYGYRAPFDIYFNMHREGAFTALETEDSNREFVLCYGKEWHRFPTSFFLPSRKWNVRFIESDFKGQLPNLYPAGDPEGTKRIPENMNDLNAEEPTRYVPVADCDFLVDSFSLDSDGTSVKEPNYAASKEWSIISEQDFLNAKKSSPFFRAFYIPFLSAKYTVYDQYVLLKRHNMRKGARRKTKDSKGRTGQPKSLDHDFDNLDDEL